MRHRNVVPLQPTGHARSLLNYVVLGRGASSRLAALVKSDSGVDTRGRPAVFSVALGCGCRQDPWMEVVLGDGPGSAGVVQAHRDESAQVQCRGSVVQPVIVLGHSAVADFAVVAGKPGDGAFDHGAVLAVFGLSGTLACVRSGAAQVRFVDADGELASVFGGGALNSQRT
jgi:hypothetical protein